MRERWLRGQNIWFTSFSYSSDHSLTILFCMEASASVSCNHVFLLICPLYITNVASKGYIVLLKSNIKCLYVPFWFPESGHSPKWQLYLTHCDSYFTLPWWWSWWEKYVSDLKSWAAAQPAVAMSSIVRLILLSCYFMSLFQFPPFYLIPDSVN